MKKISVLLLSFVALFVYACNEQSGSESGSKSVSATAASIQKIFQYSGTPASTTQLNSVSAKPGLREKLPEKTIAYLRIPSLWGFLSTPKGTALDKALRDSEHVLIINKLRAALYKNVFKMSQSKATKFVSFLFTHLRAPIEVAVFTGKKETPLFTMGGVIYTKVDFKTIKEASDYLTSLLAQIPPLTMSGPLDDKGFASVSWGATRPGYIYFNVKTGELYLGFGLSAQNVAAVKAQFKLRKHVMQELEQKVDQSGQGYVVWVDVENVLIQLKPMMPSSMYRFVAATYGQVRKVAAGWGVYKGKSRLKIVADVPWDFPAYTSVIGKDINLTTSGSPSYLLGFAVPGPKHWSVYKPVILGLPGSYRSKHYQANMIKMKSNIGFTVDEIISNLGPQILFFGDKVGYYAAIQIRNLKNFNLMVKSIVSITKIPYKKYSRNGAVVNYLVVPQLNQGTRRMLSRMPLPFRMFLKQKTHLYWTVEGNYAVFAAVPQMLTDRARYPVKVNMGQWLAKQQKQSPENAALLLSVTTEGTAQFLYYSYLSSLQILADMFDEKIEIAKLPSVNELNIPLKGTYGLQVNLFKNRLSAELVFENNPLEFLFNPKGMVLIAAVGVGAAIAIPAYQHYVLSTKVYGSISMADTTKMKVVKFYVKNKKFPGVDDVKLINSNLVYHSVVRKISVEPDTGKIIMEYEGSRQLRGRTVMFQPIVVNGGAIAWKCGTNMRYKLVPPNCRNYIR